MHLPSSCPEPILPLLGSGTEASALVETLLCSMREHLSRPTGALHPPMSQTELSRRVHAMVGPTITSGGIGVEQALALFSEVLSREGLSCNHPGYLSYVACVPSVSAAAMDGLVSATAMIGSGWIGGAGLIWAENQALRWLADLAGMDAAAGGCFVSGGTAGNFSALATAREAAQRARATQRGGGCVLAAASAHSSITSAARLLGLSVVDVAVDERGRMNAAALAHTLKELERDGMLEQVVAVVATAGATNTGLVDDLAGVGELARQAGLWFHVDAAYGGAFLCVPELRALFSGIELADSVVIDPHKGLFVPFDCCALLLARPALAIPAFTQDAPYLEEVNASEEWNPMHYAFHLTRRPRGVPLWFTLAAHGTAAYTATLREVLRRTRQVLAEARSHACLEVVVEPALSIVLLRRLGWSHRDYTSWSERVLRAGIAYAVPTRWQGETVIRLCLLNPRLDAARINSLLASLTETPPEGTGTAASLPKV